MVYHEDGLSDKADGRELGFDEESLSLEETFNLPLCESCGSEIRYNEGQAVHYCPICEPDLRE